MDRRNLFGGTRSYIVSDRKAMAPTDNALMEAVRDGQIEKLAVLFERHQVVLFNFFLRLTGNRSASEDLVQDVFARILRYRAGYQGRDRFFVWMYRIARNAHIDHLRKRKAELPLDEAVAEPAAVGPGPEEVVEAEHEAALVHRALARLPWKKREVLMLSRYEGLKLREIADLLDCEVGTVKAQVHRALKELGGIYLELRDGGTT
jgi:RNA polymerase sigma factor (sigma-70 family)